MPTATPTATARHYAAAAFGVAAEQGDFDTWMAALDQAAALLRMRSARIVLTTPTIQPADKRAALERLFPNVPQYVRNFFNILAERDRLDQLEGIAQAYRALVNERRDVLIAEVTTAIPLDPESQRLVAERLGTYFGRPADHIAIEARVDPSIIGGVVARVGDTLIDDSVRGRLERLRRTLASA